MRHTIAALLAAAAVFVAAPASAEVRLSIADGKVSLAAHGATLGQIMAEWARVGQTRVVNAERVSGGALNIELTDVPEAQALEILLRNAGGYLLAPRRNASVSASASVYDRILIFAVSSAPRPVAMPAQAVATPPVFPQPRIVAPRPPEPRAEPDAPPAAPEPPPPPPAGAAQVSPPAAATASPAAAADARAPVFNTFPPNEAQPSATPGATTFPGMLTAPAGSRTPGTFLPAPAQGATGNNQNRPQ